MAEPGFKRLKTSLPVCKTHKTFAGSRVRQSLPAAVEEGVCGVAALLAERAYSLRALASIFEQDDVALPRVASFFHQESLWEQAQTEAMMDYLAQRGGQYCNKNIQRPGCEAVCGVLPALDLMLGQLKEEMAVLVELSQLARDHADPHTASVVKSRFLGPLVPRVKLLGDLLTSTRRVGCTNDRAGGFGEYLINELQEELASI
ncbi:LOW QUALITY PROTEIN: ferritin light chain, oocyte isoform-like [Lampris incognitus]|uniref:LOW QUALITY PROTEIN: ferritin light chain, oocyte isoform-like n=1 Tax=Lampris incognitus TaxID=2546036 RepID=UPI0024B48986|nr:LOW QUALITY PROTEIN: ferritin light chain, oocyte isoform-like [Lampris incognitus]